MRVVRARMSATRDIRGGGEEGHDISGQLLELACDGVNKRIVMMGLCG